MEQYELEDTAVLTWRNARGDDDLLGTDGKPVTLEVYGPGSQQGRKATFKQRRANDLRSFRALRGEYPPNDQENSERERAEKLVGIVKSISSNWPYTPGQTFGNPRLIYLHEQVEEFFAKNGSFWKGQSPS